MIIKALERAWSDGMDIINLSVGGAVGAKDSAEALFASELTKRGVLVVASQGANVNYVFNTRK